MAPKKRKPIKSKATTEPMSPTRGSTQHATRAKARTIDDEPDPSTDMQVAVLERSVQVIVKEQVVEALRQQAAEASVRVEELRAQLEASQADSIHLTTLL